jgi:methionyl-tRNA synthetase
LPFTAKKLSRILKVETPLPWSAISETSDLIPAGQQIGEALLLPKLKMKNSETNRQTRSHQSRQQGRKQDSRTGKEAIQFDDFAKMDMRVGTIIEASKMPKANKLLILKVDTGIDVRTIVSGIAESFKPEDIVGKKVTVLVNLAPRNLRG